MGEILKSSTKNYFRKVVSAVTIKNRVVMPPMEVGMANPDGTPSEQLIAIMKNERATVWDC